MHSRMDDTERVGAMVSNKEQHRTHLLDYIHIYIKNNIDKSNTIFSLSCVHNRVRSSDESVTSDYLINNKAHTTASIERSQHQSKREEFTTKIQNNKLSPCPSAKATGAIVLCWCVRACADFKAISGSALVARID